MLPLIIYKKGKEFRLQLHMGALDDNWGGLELEFALELCHPQSPSWFLFNCQEL